MNNTEWFYSRDGRVQEGPVAADTLTQMLNSGQLPADTLVWHEGCADWTPAAEAPDLNWKRVTRPPPLPQQRIEVPIGSTPHHAAGNTSALPRLEIKPKSRRNAVLLLIGCGVFVVAGAWMVVEPETLLDQIIGLVSILFFGVAGIIAVPRLLRRKNSMVLTPEALEQVTIYGNATVPWSDVEHIGRVRYLGQSFLGVRLKSYDRYLQGVSQELAANLKRGLPYLRIAAAVSNTLPAPPIVKLWSSLEEHDSPTASLAAFGKVGDLAGVLHWTRKKFGYDILFAWADFDRPVGQLVKVMEEYRNADTR